MDGTRFKINSPPVVQETIDDEVIIVNLDGGSYYSVDKAGARIWNGIERGLSVEEIILDLVRNYEASRAEIEAEVARLLSEFRRENLIAVRDGGHQSEERQIDAEAISTSRGAFESPVLHKYTDMQDLLMLDPVHEVDETGWPTIKPQTAAK